jgi:hypothetical protein
VKKDPKHPERRLLTPCAQKILSRDSPAPALGSMLFTDLVHRVLPLWPILSWLAPDWGIPKWFRDRDRAAALETSWEESWRVALPQQPNLLAGSFLNLWTEDKPYPALLLNGTSVLSGRRIIPSNLKFANWDYDDLAPFPDAADFYRMSGMAIRVSTAINNSARFPVIGPAGTFEVKQPDERPDNSRIKRGSEQIVDGGYFENYGAATALDLVIAITRSFPKFRKKFEEKHDTLAPGLRFMVVQISSDPEYPFEGTDVLASGQIGGDFLAPLFALANTRTSRGLYQSSLTKGALNAVNPHEQEDQYVHIFMDTKYGWGVPLGWTLSERTRKSLEPGEEQEMRFRRILKPILTLSGAPANGSTETSLDDHDNETEALNTAEGY